MHPVSGAGVHAPPPEGSAFEYPASRAPADRRRAQQGARGRLRPRGAGSPTRTPRTSSGWRCSSRSRARGSSSWRPSGTRSRSDKRPSPVLRALAELDFPRGDHDELRPAVRERAGGRRASSRGWPSTRRTSRPRPTSATPPRTARSSSRSTATSRARRPIVITDEDYIQFVLRMSNKEPYDPVPLTLKFYLTGWTTLFVGYSLLDYNLRLLFKTLRWKIDSGERAGHVLGRLPARPADLRRLAQPAPLREVHRPGRLGVRPQALRAGPRQGARSRSRPGGERRRRSRRLPYRGHPSVPLHGPPDLLRARGGDAPAREPRGGLPRRAALRRLRRRQVVADQRRAAPPGDTARLPSRAPPRAATRGRGARASSGSRSPRTTPSSCPRCSRPTTTRRGSCSRSEAFEERLRAVCADATAR